MIKFVCNKNLVFLILLSVSIFLNSNMIISASANRADISNKYGGSLIDSISADAQTFNPVILSDSFSSKISGFIFEGMMTYDKDMCIVPQLAHSWDISEDKLDYTFYLREDVKWHDGKQFTSDDVVFTWDRILDPETDTFGAQFFYFLNQDLIPYGKVDEYTVTFHLKESISPSTVLGYFMFNIIPQHAYLNYLGEDGIAFTSDDCRDVFGKYTFNDDPVNENPIGTGCMIFDQWNKDENITLIRNSIENGGPGYWNGHDAYLDSYVVKIIPDVNVQLMDLQNGKIDMMDLSSTSQYEVLDLKANPNITVYSAPTFTSDHIAFQCDPKKGEIYGQEERDFITDPNYFAGFEWQTTEQPEIKGYLVRQALNYALDKEDIINVTYPQGYRNLGPMYLAQYEWYNDDVNPYNYNLTKANELLDIAGFGATADDPLRKLLNFTLTANQGSWRRPMTIELVSNQWAELGIDVETQMLEWVSMLTTHYDGRNFDAIHGGSAGGGGSPDFTNVWSSHYIMPGGYPIGFDIDGSWLWDGEPKPGGLNYASYWNPTVDLLMDEARTEEDHNIRKELYNQIQEIIVDDCPSIFLLAHVYMNALSSDFYGFVDGSIAGLWPEPIGFRNIYFMSEIEENNSSLDSNFTNGFEIIMSFVSLFSIVLYLKKKG